MRILILLLALLFLFGTLLLAMPSPRMRRLAELRRRAQARGLSIRVRSSPSWPLLAAQVAWALELPKSVSSPLWRLAAVSSMNAVLPGSTEGGGDPWRLPGWIGEGRLPPLSERQKQQLQELLLLLPADTDAIGADERHALLTWKEADPDKLDAVVRLLKFVAAVSSGKAD